MNETGHVVFQIQSSIPQAPQLRHEQSKEKNCAWKCWKATDHSDLRVFFFTKLWLFVLLLISTYPNTTMYKNTAICCVFAFSNNTNQQHQCPSMHNMFPSKPNIKTRRSDTWVLPAPRLTLTTKSVRFDCYDPSRSWPPAWRSERWDL